MHGSRFYVRVGKESGERGFILATACSATATRREVDERRRVKKEL